MPAPHRMVMSGLILWTKLTVSEMTSGLALETLIPEPISSGGSMDVMSGCIAATAALTAGLFAQTQEVKPFSRQSAIVVSMSISRI